MHAALFACWLPDNRNWCKKASKADEKSFEIKAHCGPIQQHPPSCLHSPTTIWPKNALLAAPKPCRLLFPTDAPSALEHPN